MSLAARVGFFGKLPARGDFLRANLSRDSIAALDDWLQAVMPAAAMLLGEESWHALWDQAPAWRFHLPQGVCGPKRLGGVWLPSRDAAGRAFPLILVVEEHDPGARILDELQRLGADAVQGGLTPDHLALELALIAPSLPIHPRPAPSDTAGQWWRPPGRTPLTLRAMPGADDLARMLAAS